jgi:hypothetical protein
MKKTLLIFLFSVLISSNALACNLNKFVIGKDLSSFEEEKKTFLIGEPIKNIKSISFPIEFICEKSELDRTLISLFFMNDKIIRIIFQNQLAQNRSLFKLANKNYKAGFKKNQTLINNNEPEQYGVEKNGIYYLYGNFRGINENKGNFLEMFEVVDKKFEDVATKEAIKIEEK